MFAIQSRNHFYKLLSVFGVCDNNLSLGCHFTLQMTVASLHALFTEVSKRVLLIEHLQELAAVSLQNMELYRHADIKAAVCLHKYGNVLLIFGIESPASKACVDNLAEGLECVHELLCQVQPGLVVHEALVQPGLKRFNVVQYSLSIIS